MNNENVVTICITTVLVTLILAVSINITYYNTNLNNKALERGLVQGSLHGIHGVYWVSPTNSVSR